MRTTLLLFIFIIGGLAAHAEEYPYLTFETTDGAKTSVSVESLSLTFSGTTLTAGSQTFDLSNLTKMYFSTADETTGIETLTVDALSEMTNIYDLQGKEIRKEQMEKGVYIIKTKQGTYKILRK
ncbi:MAG: hypothetical protein IKR91_04535 [Alloprevotella sp.]|nr:hypothetical protein [Alloprevotella sp.]